MKETAKTKKFFEIQKKKKKMIIVDQNSEHGFISDAGEVMVESDRSVSRLPRFAVWKMHPSKRKLQVCFVSDVLNQCKLFLASSYFTEEDYEYALEQREEAMKIEKAK